MHASSCHEGSRRTVLRYLTRPDKCVGMCIVLVNISVIPVQYPLFAESVV